MVYVFDASFVGALIIPDEINPGVEEIYSGIGEDEIFAPQLLWYEVANIFNNLLRRRRHNYNEVRQLIPALAAIRLKTDFETGAVYSEKLLRLCTEYNLSSYDIAYLELAERKKAILCTLDGGLQTAAKKHGIAIATR